MSYVVFASGDSLSSIRGASVRRFSRNLLILFSVNRRVKGLSFIFGVFILISVKFGKWSDRSVIRLPDEHLLWISFFGGLIMM